MKTQTAKIEGQGEPVSATLQTLRSLKDLEGYKIAEKDGHIGKVHDFFFDDEFWVVRYLVVDTGSWLPGRKVLLSPGVLLTPDWNAREFTVALTRDQVKNSPDIDTDKPVSRQREMELRTYYGWPFYWTGGGAWPEPIPLMPPLEPPPPKTREEGDPHLRSVREMIGYNIEADDGEIGFVDDFIAEEETWVIRYLVVSTHKWLPGRKVLVAPHWIAGRISWAKQTVKLNMSRASVKNSPEFDPSAPVNREYETRLYDYYGRPKYWT
jgi:uncharacterized protein YrrD